MPSSLEPQNPPVYLYPAVPLPDATVNEIQEFLIGMLLAIKPNFTREEASTLSGTFDLDGVLLYELPREIFIDKFGSVAGLDIFNALNTSKYGYVRLLLLINSSIITAVF